MLGGVCLVDDQEPPAATKCRRVLDELCKRGERLNRGGEDSFALREVMPEFFGFRRVVARDVLDHAFGGLEERETVGDVAVERGAVGDDNDTVEQLRAVPVEHFVSAVRKPGDRFGFARSGGVLDEVTLAGYSAAHVVGDTLHGAQLMEAREYKPAVSAFGGWLPQRVVPDDSQEQFGGEYLFPQVRNAVPVGVGGVAGTPFFGALIEGQEHGVFALELSGHHDFARGDGEVHEAAPRIQQGAGRFLGDAVAAILGNGVGNRLGVVGFEFHRDDGDAVDEENEVNFSAVAFFEVDLLQHSQPVRLSFFHGVCFCGIVRKEACHICKDDGPTVSLREGETVAQRSEQPTINLACDSVEARFPVEFFRKPTKQSHFACLAFDLACFSRDRPLIFVRILRGKPMEHVAGKQPEFRIKAAVVCAFIPDPPLGSKRPADRQLHCFFMNRVHHGLNLLPSRHHFGNERRFPRFKVLNELRCFLDEELHLGSLAVEPHSSFTLLSNTRNWNLSISNHVHSDRFDSCHCSTVLHLFGKIAFEAPKKIFWIHTVKIIQHINALMGAKSTLCKVENLSDSSTITRS